MKNKFNIYETPDEYDMLGQEQLAELFDYWSHGDYLNEGGEFLNDEIRTVDQVFPYNEEAL